MPETIQIVKVKISIADFLSSCTPEELYEVQQLINSPMFQPQIKTPKNHG